MTSARRIAVAAALVVVVTTIGAACSWDRHPGPGVDRHPLPRLPELGTVALPTGFVGYDKATAPYASRNTVHVDSAFFEFGASTDFGGNHHCRAQITVSRYDPTLATPQAYVRELGTKVCDSAWFVTAFDEGWSERAPGLWTLDLVTSRQGAATGVLRLDAARGVVVGLWATAAVYPADEAVAVAEQVTASIG